MKFAKPMFQNILVKKFEDKVEVTQIYCNKCGRLVRPIRVTRTKGLPWDVVKMKIWAMIDHVHTCNPLDLKDSDPGAGDRVVNEYGERELLKQKVGAPSFVDEATRKLLGQTPGNA